MKKALLLALALASSGFAADNHPGSPRTHVSVLDSAEAVVYSPRGLGGAPAFTASTVAGLRAWYKADDGPLNGGVAPANADPVTAWNDQSGNNRHTTQATAANQPTLRTGVINGLPAVRFDGAGDNLKASFTSAQPVTILAVLKRNGNDSSGYAWDGGTQNDSMGFWVSNAGGTMKMSAGNSDCDITIGSAYHIVALVYNGTSAASYLDGATATATCNTGTRSPAGVTLGDFAGTGFAMQVEIAEFMMYGGVLSSANRKAVEAYLSGKYAIAVTP